MFTYEAMECRACGRMIEPDPRTVDKPKKATSWASCVFRCECGVAYSNAREPSGRRPICREPEANVPAAVSDGLSTVLGKALNIQNRESKLASFCSAFSEDAVTWTVFRFLQETKQLGVLASLAGREAPPSAPELLLWGVPLPPSDAANGILERLLEVSDELGENPSARTEPDVIVSWPDLLIFVEVKYRSDNPRQPDYPQFWRYLADESLFTASVSEVKGVGYYELVRNWVIGTKVAAGKSFVLLNLVLPRAISQGREFETQVCQDGNRVFLVVDWREFLQEVSVTPHWVKSFLESRELSD